MVKEGIGRQSLSVPDRVAAFASLGGLIFVYAVVASAGWQLGQYWFMRIFYWVMTP